MTPDEVQVTLSLEEACKLVQLFEARELDEVPLTSSFMITVADKIRSALMGEAA